MATGRTLNYQLGGDNVQTCQLHWHAFLNFQGLEPDFCVLSLICTAAVAKSIVSCFVL
jgi:hypothetical protein